MIEPDPTHKLAVEVLKLIGLAKMLPWIALVLITGWFGFWLVFHTVEWIIGHASFVLAWTGSMVGMAALMGVWSWVTQ